MEKAESGENERSEFAPSRSNEVCREIAGIAVPKPRSSSISGHKPGDISEELCLLLKDDVPLLKQHIDRLEFPFLRKQ